MKALPERRKVLPDDFEATIRSEARPVVLRDHVAEWPVVRAASAGYDALVQYLCAAGDAPVEVVRAGPQAKGRFHYDAAVTGPNFIRGPASLKAFLSALLAEAGKRDPDSLAIQGATANSIFPGFAETHRLNLLPAEAVPRLWISNATKVATHCDPSENIACVVAGRRRFTLFPPEQLKNLYMGPFHITPAGTPVSMVHLTDPDFERYPRFADALAAAETAELEAGDAVYIPYGWYHHVEAIEPVNMLVNFWWNPARADIGSPWDVLMHGMMTLRNMPSDQRRAWRAMFDHYVFLINGDPCSHLPVASQGILAANEASEISQMRRNLIAVLQAESGQGKR